MVHTLYICMLFFVISEGKKKLQERDKESTVQITMTSNANYDANRKAKKKSGFLKGIGQLLK